MITSSEKRKLIEDAVKNRIYLFSDLTEAQNQIAKNGNDTMKVLLELLIQEINKHNGVIQKKVNKISNLGTSD